MKAAPAAHVTAAEFHAHALAMEREAARRYWEIAHELLLYRKNAIAATLLALARRQGENLDALELKAAGMALPPVATSEHVWHGIESADGQPHFIARCIAHPEHALQIALENCRRAEAFYERMAAPPGDPQTARRAVRIRSEKRMQIAFIEHALRPTPARKTLRARLAEAAPA